MERRGAIMLEANLRERVFCAIYGRRDAKLQTGALAFGAIDSFTENEVGLACRFPEATRAWALDYRYVRFVDDARASATGG
jgi:hypothetical protein